MDAELNGNDLEGLEGHDVGYYSDFEQAESSLGSLAQLYGQYWKGMKDAGVPVQVADQITLDYAVRANTLLFNNTVSSMAQRQAQELLANKRVHKPRPKRQ